MSRKSFHCALVVAVVLVHSAHAQPVPPNNACSAAITISPGDTPFVTAGATTDGPTHAACAPPGETQVSNDVWFKFTAPCTTPVAVILCLSTQTYDSKLAIYNTCNCAALSDATLVDCDDNGCQFMGLSAITFPATSGTCYLIRVGGNATAVTADGTLSVSCGFPACGPQNPNDCFATNTTPGCSDTACCNAVCAVDPFCCTISWDGICDGEADDLCEPPVCVPTDPTDCDGNQVADQCEVADFNTVYTEDFEAPDFTPASGPGTGGWGWSSSIAGITTTNPCQGAQNLSTSACDFGICDAACADAAMTLAQSPNFVPVTTPQFDDVLQRLNLKLRVDGAAGTLCDSPTFFLTPFHNDFPGGGQPVTRIGLRPSGMIVIDAEGDGSPPYVPASTGIGYPLNACFDLAVVTDRSQPAASRLQLFVNGALVHSGDVVVAGDPVTFLQALLIESNNHAANRTLRLDGIELQHSHSAAGDANLDGQVDGCKSPPLVDIASANPPLDNPFVAGVQPFRDALQTGTTPALTQGIGAAGTPAQDSVTYAPLSVTFSGTPSPAPTPGNVTIACTGGTCPSVTGVTGGGAGPYQVALSGAIPPGHCTTITFVGTNVGQKVQYQSLPGDVNMNGSTSPTDVLALPIAINNGMANLPANLARYNINRASIVNALDVLRLVGLLNGVQTTQPWTGVSVAACP